MVVNFMLSNWPASDFTQTLPILRCFLTVKYAIIYTENERDFKNVEVHR